MIPRHRYTQCEDSDGVYPTPISAALSSSHYGGEVRVGALQTLRGWGDSSEPPSLADVDHQESLPFSIFVRCVVGPDCPTFVLFYGGGWRRFQNDPRLAVFLAGLAKELETGCRDFSGRISRSLSPIEGGGYFLPVIGCVVGKALRSAPEQPAQIDLVGIALPQSVGPEVEEAERQAFAKSRHLVAEAPDQLSTGSLLELGQGGAVRFGCRFAVDSPLDGLEQQGDEGWAVLLENLVTPVDDRAHGGGSRTSRIAQ